MRLHFLGAAQTVTGSQHLLEVNGHKLLLDCGLYQGRRKDAIKRNSEFGFAVDELDAVLLSHGHIDHSGKLPRLVKHGYEGPIHAQNATAHLSELMLADSGHIQESSLRHLNRRRAKRGEEPIEPLYTVEDAERAAALMVEQNYERAFEPIPGVRATFVEAGHILGSASIILDIEENGRKVRLWVSGDIGPPNLPLIRDPQYPQRVDYLLMESTYGDRPQRSHDEANEELHRVVKDTLERGGKVIIPAFAVGRTQDLVYTLHQLMDAGDIPSVPVFVDSPLAVNVTDLFRAHPECFDEEALKMIESDKHRAALGFDRLTYIRSVEESKELNERKESMIIISASGMMEVGRVLHHLEHNIHDENSVVLIVSWMAPHTLGRRLQDGDEQVKIFGEVHERKIRVANVRGFSAHAGQNGLRDYALGVKDSVKKVFLVHGEARAAEPLQEILAAQGMQETYFPEMGSSAEL
jgi:metallo-beta-lactamase family protein